jgi:type I site-specific restriction-modification system R (restriction) subunit
MKAETQELFGEVISSYTDAEAVDDGVLVSINQRDRVTSAVWGWLNSTVDMKNAKPPSCWPVDMMEWFTAKKADERVHAMTSAIIDEKRKQATRVYEENTEGGIFQLWAKIGANEKPLSLEDTEPQGACKRLWILPNENDGVTLMFPEDY